MKQRLSLILWLSLSVYASAQTDEGWRFPLDGPRYLSGTFAELRSNHFHAGLDIKTDGKVGAPVYAADSGYVSRIAVSPYGYGLALYIDHPHRNRTTVYAHLDELIPELAYYVLEQQYRRNSFEVNLYLKPGKFPIARGQRIARSGNSGGSGGPHLHFEIRNRANQHPLNPLEEGIYIPDEVPPFLGQLSLMVGTEGRRRIPLPLPAKTSAQADSWNLGSVEVPSRVDLGLMLYAYDQQTGSLNKNGIYALTLMVRDSLVFQWLASELSFDETRFCNAVMDYEQNLHTGKKVYRMHRLLGNTLASLRGQEGWFRVAQGDTVPFVLLLSDYARNTAMLTGEWIGGRGEDALECPDSLNGWVKWDQSFRYDAEQVKVNIPSGSLYSSTCWEIREEEGAFRVLSPEIPAHQRFTVSLRPNNALPNDGKVIMVCEGYKGSKRAEPCTFVQGWYEADFRDFGTFYLTRDTVPPSFTLVRQSGRTLIFKAVDALLSIDTYAAYLNDTWTLLEYDAKSDRFILEVDDRYIGQRVEVRVEVGDEVKNRAKWVKMITF
jgi:hypothetical protein